jgi:hypothetical protein
MADNVENLMLEHLKRFQATLDRLERKQDELIGRVANLEGSMASLLFGSRRRCAAGSNRKCQPST